MYFSLVVEFKIPLQIHCLEFTQGTFDENHVHKCANETAQQTDVELKQRPRLRWDNEERRFELESESTVVS